MIDFVGTIHEIRVCCIDSDLDFAVNLVVQLNVDQNVVGGEFQSVLNSGNLKFFFLFFCHFFNLTKNSKNFFFFRSILAAQNVRDFKAQ
jgi:hypothetical protein